MKAKILLTGFKPFSIYPVNPSWEAAKRIQENDNDVVIKELRVDHATAEFELLGLLQSLKPDVLLLSGLADRGVVALETTARKPAALHLAEGPHLLTGVWPWKETVKSLKEKSIPFAVSEDAGRYVCETAYWTALHFRSIHGYPKFVCFVHVPLVSGIWTIHAIAEAVEAILTTAREAHRFQ